MQYIISLLLLGFLTVFGESYAQVRTMEPEKKATQFERQFIEASKYKITRDYSKAIELLEKMEKSYAKEAIIPYEISRIYWIKRNYKEAEKKAEDAYALSPNTTEIVEHYLQLLKKNKNYVNLRQLYQIKVENEPNNVLNFQKLALYQEKCQDDKNAWKTYTTIEKKFNRPDISLPKKAEIYLRQGDSKKAIKLLVKLVELYPENIHYWKKLSIVYQQENQPSSARECYFKIIDIDPRDTYANAQLIDDFLAKGDTAQYLNALLLSIDNKQITEERAIQVFDFLESRDRSRFSQISVIANKLNKLFPDSPISFNYAEFLVRQKKYTAALNVLISSPKKLHKSATYYNLKLALLLKLHRSRQLLDETKAYQLLYPSNINGYLFQSLGYCLEMNHEKANESITKARKSCFGDSKQLEKVDMIHQLILSYRGTFNNNALDKTIHQNILLSPLTDYTVMALIETKQYTSLEALLEKNTFSHAAIIDVLIQDIDQTDRLKELLGSDNQFPAALYEYIGDYFAKYHQPDNALMYWNIAQPYIRADRIQTKKDAISAK